METDAIEFDDATDGESEDTPLGPGARRILTKVEQPQLSALWHKYKKGRLVVQPEFQRKYVWDRKKASRLVESALMGIPLPIVYLSEEPDGRTHVIDGQQRLTSFFSFFDGTLPGGSAFRLTGLQAFPDLERKAFADLGDEFQEKLQDYGLTTITFLKESDADLKFEIFERLNSGSVALNDQELRNCVYRGSFNSLLKELAADPEFRRLVGLRSEEARMRDIELVLRFVAFHNQTYLNYRPPMKRFLNHEMEERRSLSDARAAEIRAAFKTAVANVHTVLGEHAFKRYYRGDERNPNGRWEEKKFNASLYDVLMVTLAREDRNRLTRNADAVREALLHLLTEDEGFTQSILLSTSSAQAVTKRFDMWRTALSDALAGDSVEPRLFTYAQRKQLFEADPTCSLCGNVIQTLDDAAVDHIVPFVEGGRTTLDNARLAHRYCNWARPRHEVPVEPAA